MLLTSGHVFLRQEILRCGHSRGRHRAADQSCAGSGGARLLRRSSGLSIRRRTSGTSLSGRRRRNEVRRSSRNNGGCASGDLLWKRHKSQGPSERKIDKGGNWINLTVTRGSKYPPLLLSGAVQPPDNTPAGNLTYENHDMQPWDSPTQLICIPGAPVEDRPLPRPAPAPAPEPVAQQPAPPAGQAPTEAAAPPPEEAAPPPPEQDQPCIPDPFDLNFPGAC
jgi:hypothetical protein